ncbi:MAG TPA: FAD-binding oxidoreductase [Acidimicrobiales bacterium]|jgi:FAD/FMN-containing dehydrogenase|nr:FAD-binding oxidoreductase [Acidimicrobiales bacterium]
MTPRSTTLDPALRRVLHDIVTPAHVLEDPGITAGFARDWTGRHQGVTTAVVRPASTAEVAAVLRACADQGMSVVPQGGNTGLVAGGVAADGEITLALTRIDGIAPVDAADAQVTVGAGVALSALHTTARAAQLEFPVDLSARESATIGGMVATNAGGLHVIRHGAMRAQLTGIEAVRSTGAVIGDLRGLLKDNTGYHWPSVLCGSEGTLAVVTRVRVRLVAPAEDRAVALLAFAEAPAAVVAAGHLRTALPDVDAIELVTAEGITLVCDSLRLPRPFAEPAPVALLVEVAGTTGAVERLAAAVGDVASVQDAAVAVDPERRAALWRYREAHTESIARLGPVHKLDVTLPAGALATFMDEVRARIGGLRPEARVWLFGHAGDGNIHVNVTGVAPDDDALDGAVLELVASHGGSISAEHGIGRAKRAFLHLNRTAADIDAMRAMKRALDPAGILNPGVLLPPV